MNCTNHYPLMHMPRPWSSKLIPEDVALELQELGYTSDSERRFFETLWRSGGPTAISRYLSGFDAADKERDRWLPQLRDYEEACKTTHPLPSKESLSPADLARYRIYYKKFCDLARKDHFEPRRKNSLVFLFSSPLGLLAAEDAVPPSDCLLRFPDRDDASWLNEFFQQEGSTFSWYISTVVMITTAENLHKYERQVLEQKFPKAVGFEYWKLTRHTHLGESHSEGSDELWKWDGENVKCVSRRF